MKNDRMTIRSKTRQLMDQRRTRNHCFHASALTFRPWFHWILLLHRRKNQIMLLETQKLYTASVPPDRGAHQWWWWWWWWRPEEMLEWLSLLSSVGDISTEALCSSILRDWTLWIRLKKSSWASGRSPATSSRSGREQRWSSILSD